MGAQQSRPEGIIIYNENVPLQRAKPTSTSGKPPLPHEVEGVVRERVAEELNRIREQQEEANNRLTAELSKKNLESKHNAVAINADIEDMIKRVQRFLSTLIKTTNETTYSDDILLCRPASKQLPAEISQKQQAVVECYRRNKARPLDCWAEVESFKDAVAQAQKEFCINHA
ncbi:hypothetical protein NQZ79_g3229 [Umbelopsis isabellina]|nr:hypothetical protein NQZ79_g3229 [Umbelopsis isabellina]